MRKFGRRALVATSAMGAASLSGCSGVLNTGSGTVAIEDITVQPADNQVRDPTVGLESIIGVSIHNTGSSQADLAVTLGVDGTDITTDQVTVQANDGRLWEYRHTFSESGTHTITANDYSREVSVVDGSKQPLETETAARATAVTRESAARGHVSIGIIVENPNDNPVAFQPDLRIGDQQVTDLQPVQPRDAPDDARIDAGQRVNYRAHVPVPAADLPVTLDGERIATASLQPRDTPYPHGTSARAGTPMPSSGIGIEPELVAQFPLQSPAALDQTRGGRVTLQAVSHDRLYAKVRWETSDRDQYSLVALDRWSGDEHWHVLADQPAEIAVVGETEYIRDGDRLQAREFDGTVRWETTVASYEYPNRIDETVTYTLPTEDALYLGTGAGITELALESGDVRRELPGVFATVGADGVYTSGGRGPVFKFPLDEGTTPEWRASPPAGTGEVAAVSDEYVFVSSSVGGQTPRDATIELFAYDVTTGEQHWSVVASTATDLGGAVVSPSISDLHVADEKVLFGSNQGYRFVEIPSGELIETGLPPRLGVGKVVANPTLVYGYGDSNSLNVASALGPLVTATESSPDPVRTTSVPDQSTLDLAGGSLLYGRGVLYLTTNGYVYGFSGTLPDDA